MGSSSKTFNAQFHGTCTACRERVYPGDVVLYDAGALIHEDCDTAYSKIPDSPKNLDTCPKCWLVRPCDCD